MDRGRKTSILITAGGVLLLLSHAAAWQLGRRPGTAAAGQADVLAKQSRESIASPADLVRRGREHEAASLAATREQEELEKLPWRDQVAAARAKLAADADLPALVRDGMTAAKASHEHASAETVAAFSKWLDLDSEAALDFIGNASRRHVTDPFRYEIGDWLGRGNEQRLDELVKRFPQATWPLHLGAQELCSERGADFALKMAASLAKPQDRWWLLDDCLEAKQWQGHLARLPAVLADDPKALRRLLSSISGDPDAAILLDEIRATGFPLEDLAQAETRIAQNAEEARKREREKENYRKEREESASPLRRQLGLAGVSLFDNDSPSEEQQLEKLAPGFADACADLGDGRQSMDEVLALVQRVWPPAADPKVEGELRSMLFDIAFTADPLGTLKAARATAWDYKEEAENMLYRLSPEMAIRVISEHPEILEDKQFAAFRLSSLFERWQESDPEACRQALLAAPDEALRTRWLERFNQNQEMMQRRSGGDR